MFQIRPMRRQDIPEGMRLKEQAGWNQIDADWNRLLDLPGHGGCVAEVGGKVVGTVVVSRFGPVGWVSMMLVDEAHRGRGIGRALMVAALEDLDRGGAISVRLDATPLGRPLYESLGFLEEAGFHRYAGILPSHEGPGDFDACQSQDQLEDLLALDRVVTGTDRHVLIRDLATEFPDSLRVVNDHRGLAGYILSRPGAKARQIGPCIADDRAGPRLFADAARRYAGQSVILDIPAVHRHAAEIAEAWGLRPARSLLRMGRGPRIAEDLARLWASAGPEKG